jgi:riboflavin transporter FmnP
MDKFNIIIGLLLLTLWTLWSIISLTMTKSKADYIVTFIVGTIFGSVGWIVLGTEFLKLIRD